MIILILLLAIVVRLISLNQSLWLDEAISVLAVQDNNLWQLITEYTKLDFHPPGFFVLLWGWTQLLNNYSEMAVRFPSVILGVLTVYLTYLLGKELYSKKLGLIAAGLMAVNPLHIYYSQEARMYSAAAFGVALSSYWLIKYLKYSGRYGFLYMLTLPFVFLFDYLTYSIVLVYLLAILFFKKSLFKSWLLLTTPTLILLLIWGLVFYQQLMVGLNTAETVKGWSAVVGGADLKNLILVPVKFTIGRISLSDKLAYAGVLTPVLIYCGFLFVTGIKKIEQRLRWGLVLLGAIPILIPFLISFFIPVFSYFRLLFLVPFYCIVLAYGVINLKRWQVFMFVTSCIFLISSLIYLFNPIYQREDWKGLIKYNSITKVINSNGNFAPLEYYMRWPKQISGIHQDNPFFFLTVSTLKNFPAQNELDLDDHLERILIQFDRIDYLEYLVDVADPNRLVQRKIESLGFKQIGVKDFTGVGRLYEYQK